MSQQYVQLPEFCPHCGAFIEDGLGDYTTPTCPVCGAHTPRKPWLT